jgi:hypothetical protein
MDPREQDVIELARASVSPFIPGLSELSIDRALTDYPALRAPIAGAALRACAAGGDLRVTARSADADPSQLFWTHRQRVGGLDLAMVEAGSGSAPDGSYIAQAEVALRTAEAFGQVDIMTLQIAGAARDRPPRGFQTALDGSFLAIERGLLRQEELPLAADYKRFLDSLGHDTRRNMHRYRRKTEAAGFAFQYTAEAPPPLQAAVRHRLGAMNTPQPKSRRRIDAHDEFVAARAMPYCATLLTQDGGIGSFATGFITGDSAYLVYQLNDAANRKMSLSLVLRGHLIEALIAQGVRALIFPNGCHGLLDAACMPRRGTVMILIRRSLTAVAKTLAVAAFADTRYIRTAVRTASRYEISQWRKARSHQSG